MLVIREEQMRVLASAVEDCFDACILDVARANLPLTEACPESVLRRRIRWAMDRAAELGLSWRSSITLFALLVLRFGPDWPGRPLVRAYLEPARPDADERMLRAFNVLPESAWYVTDDGMIDKRWLGLGMGIPQAAS